MKTAGVITGAHIRFRASVRDAVGDLDHQQRQALRTMLTALVRLALVNAAESGRRAKWMQHAYWRVVAVYAKHFRAGIRP